MCFKDDLTIPGEVYRARDEKLKRDVALKVLPEAFASDAERMARFEREAQLLASLNHPNIGAIYGLEEAESLRFLVLELIPGDTLAERLRRGPIPFAEALELAGQIADALAAAHDAGIIHRDLKPANIKITPDGQIKVLDFGLAKALADDPADAELSDSPTLSAHATKIGVILGTAAYMSPEQARGKPVDKRTDIFSFGIVLYEMLTGRQLFKGEDAADTMASVIRSDPDFRGLPAELPPRVREVLGRCLEKDPKKRRRDIGDIRAELEAPSGHVAAETPSRRGRSWIPVAAAVALSLATGVVGWHLKPDVPRLLRRFEIVLPEGSVFRGTTRHLVAMSPRGTHLVYAADDQLYVRALDQVDAVPIRGTEGGRAPFFSPDGESIGFWASGYLKKVALTGGAPANLCETNIPVGASWAADGTIVYVSSGVWQVSANGGVPEKLIDESGMIHLSPQKLPGENSLLMTVNEYARNWDDSTIVVDQLDTGERKTLMQGGSDARYVPTGHLVYAVGSTLFAVPFDLGKLQVTGGPVPVVEGVKRSTGNTGVAQFTFSEDGTLAFVSGTERLDRGLLWIDRSGQTSPLTDNKGVFSTPRLSPDGKHLAVTVAEGGGTDVWVLDIERDTFTQLTTDGASAFPDWSPDGEWLVLSSGTSAGSDLFRMRADFSAPPELLLEREGPEMHMRWMPDGSGLVFQESFGAAADLWVLDLEGDSEARLFLQTPVNEAQPDFSPDGRFIVYHSSVSGGTSQIFVQTFTGPGGRQQISPDGGRSPRWSPTGREIFYLHAGLQAIMAVDVRTEPELEFGPPRLLFEWPIGLGLSRHWDVTPDGQRFVVLGTSDTTDETRPRITFVLNWFDELERLVPTN